MVWSSGYVNCTFSDAHNTGLIEPYMYAACFGPLSGHSHVNAKFVVLLGYFCIVMPGDGMRKGRNVLHTCKAQLK